MSRNNVKKRGRPLVVLDELQVRDVETLASFLPIKGIARYLGFSIDTFYELKKRDERVFRAYNKGVAKAQVFAGKTIMKFMQYEPKNPESPSIPRLQMQLDAAKFYIRTKCDWKNEDSENDEPQTLEIIHTFIGKDIEPKEKKH